MGENKITNLGDPIADTDATTKSYVDSVAQGISIKTEVRVATTGNVSLNNEVINGGTIDEIELVEDDRVLVKNQTDATENGIYIVFRK